MDAEPSRAGHTRKRSTSLVLQQAVDDSNDSHIRGLSAEDYTHRSDDMHDAHLGAARDDSDDRHSGRSSSDWEMDAMRSDEELTDDEETGLTHTDRKKRRRRKQRNTMLDERVVNGGDLTEKEQNKIAFRSVLQQTLTNLVLIALWYGFSISISVYNTWMFSKKNLDFHYPLSTTCVHMIVQFSLASLVLFAFPRFRPNAAAASFNSRNNAQYARVNQSSQEAEDTPPIKQPIMTKWFYFTRISPCGAATALDIGLGNTSLKFITLTFYTMCKSSVLAFVLLFALLFRLERPSWKLGGIIALMTVGVIMMVADETAFEVRGFVLVMSASFFSGFRWSLTHILLLRNPATSNPFSSIFFLAPVMFFTLLVIAVPAENPANVAAGIKGLAEAKGSVMAVLILLFPGCLAFLMVASEFALLKRTSVVTLSVCGIFKEVLTISAGAIVFHDELTPINISGLLVTLASIGGYNYMKFTKMTDVAKRETHEQVQGQAPLLSNNQGREDAAEGSDEALRHSTSDLIRNTLNTQIDNRPVSKMAVGGETGDRDRHSPIKRAEDLD